MDIDDLVIYYDKDNNICSGGYVLNNTLKNLNMPSLFGNNRIVQKGGGALDNIAIPAGLVLMQQIMGEAHNSSFSEKRVVGPAPTDLYTELLKLAKVSNSKKKRLTRKQRRKRKNKSRKI